VLNIPLQSEPITTKVVSADTPASPTLYTSKYYDIINIHSSSHTHGRSWLSIKHSSVIRYLSLWLSKLVNVGANLSEFKMDAHCSKYDILQ